MSAISRAGACTVASRNQLTTSCPGVASDEMIEAPKTCGSREGHRRESRTSIDMAK